MDVPSCIFSRDIFLYDNRISIIEYRISIIDIRVIRDVTYNSSMLDYGMSCAAANAL
jgi:hypothetical protein